MCIFIRFIVKSGLNFGMDYSVYRNLPRYCHSEFCIKIMHSFERVEKDSKSIDKQFKYIHTTKENFTWKELSALTRVMPVRRPKTTLFLISYLFNSILL